MARLAPLPELRMAVFHLVTPANHSCPSTGLQTTNPHHHSRPVLVNLFTQADPAPAVDTHWPTTVITDWRKERQKGEKSMK